MFTAADWCSASIGVLVLFGCTLDPIDRYCRTPLMFATMKHRNVDAVRSLLSLNADITKTDKNGETAFQLATNDAMKQLLLAHQMKLVKTKRNILFEFRQLF